jgi:MoaA/NifB/PqqE/SkfB family radical SAM enzyme
MQKLKYIFNDSTIKDRDFSINDVYAVLNKMPSVIPQLNHVYIEIASDCQLKCIMCPRQKMARNAGRMEFELYKKIIDEIAAINFSRGIRVRDDISIDFSLFGEPLLHPDFMQMLGYLKEKMDLKEECPPVYLYTNGIELSPEVSKELLKMNLEGIIFSLDAIDGKAFKDIKGTDKYNQVLKNISEFIRLKSELKNWKQAKGWDSDDKNERNR